MVTSKIGKDKIIKYSLQFPVSKLSKTLNPTEIARTSPIVKGNQNKEKVIDLYRIGVHSIIKADKIGLATPIVTPREALININE